jgi:hypothetical protein
MLSFKRRFFTEGLAGAWSFPPLVPLAILARPPERTELRDMAEKLRSMLGNEKITGAAWTRGAFPQVKGKADLSLPALWGVSLAMPLPKRIIGEKENSLPFDKAILVSALVRDFDAVPGGLPAPDSISFRAAALAFMLFAPLEADSPGGSPANTTGKNGSLSFAWELDEPIWLPNPKRKSRG